MRRSTEYIQQREKLAHDVCKAKGWRYIVHTEQDLPKGGELANLEMLIDYSPSIYASSLVSQAVFDLLVPYQKMPIGLLAIRLSQELSLPEHRIYQALLHMLWHGELLADFSKLLFIYCSPAKTSLVWTDRKDK